jgi:hypothetical protein
MLSGMAIQAAGNRMHPSPWRLRATLVGALAAAILCGTPAAWSQIRIKRVRPRERAKPTAAWDKATASAFFTDAFATLEGERPDFAAAENDAEAAALPEAAPAAGGFKWSSLVSADTLVDEIKHMKGIAAKAVASASDFKGGGYNDVRQAFSSIALCFAVIKGYDGDVRFKRDAAIARDLFARAGSNCKVGTQQSLNEAKARVADLDLLLQGNSLEALPDGGAGEPSWSKIAARPALMSRLGTADEVASAAVASKEDFGKQVAKLLHEVELVALIGEAIQRPDHEYHDDETYRGYAAEMRDAAVKARAAARRSDYDAARAAVGELKKSCDTCHGAYRN